MNIVIINGPNLNLLGVREPGIYGDKSFESCLEELRKKNIGDKIEYFQSNCEGLLIDELHRVGFDADGIIINAGAYTHTSIAIGDAIRAIKAPVVEVHMTNVFGREDFRKVSMIASACVGVIAGFGLGSYDLALKALRSNMR
ncbi:MAG: type II 3-dehydroquinate dehydratase [Muribaculaceae bacterium]